MEAEPSRLNAPNAPGSLTSVSQDCLTVEYAGFFPHPDNVGVAQANWPAPTRKAIYYFEMYVENGGRHAFITIGFTPHDFNKRRRPGSEENSCGYYGHDGIVYQGGVNGEKFDAQFRTGDTVGAGINYLSQEFFFTINGNLIGTVAKQTTGPMFPTVAVNDQTEKVTVNFGQGPFRFNMEAYVLEEQTNLKNVIENVTLPPNSCSQIIRSYLAHRGYGETLNAFDKESRDFIHLTEVEQKNSLDIPEGYELERRTMLRQLISKGEIDSAMEKLQEWYGRTALMERTPLWTLLHMQKFIELIRIGESEAAEKYSANNLGAYIGSDRRGSLVKDCISLLEHDQPAESGVRHFLEMNQREIVADAVNVEILRTDPNAHGRNKGVFSRLDKVLQQLSVCRKVMQNLSGGENYDLEQAIHSPK